MSGSTNGGSARGPRKAARADSARFDPAPLLHRLAADVVLRHVSGARVLDVGGAVPLVAEVVAPRAATFTVAPVPGPGASLPHRDASLDVIVCLRSLPFLALDSATSEARAAAVLAELARVTAPGGRVLVDIDNPQSFRGAYFGVRNPMKALETGPLVVETEDGPNRFDRLGRFLRHLPPTLQLTDLHGLQVLAALPDIHRTPVLGALLSRAEWWVRDLGLTRRFGAHLLLVLRKLGTGGD